jgi:hypothetical protein
VHKTGFSCAIFELTKNFQGTLEAGYKYQHPFYITHVSGHAGGLEAEPEKVVQAINPMGAPSVYTY